MPWLSAFSASSLTISSIVPLGDLRGTAHQVQGDAGGAPRDQRKHCDHVAAVVQRFDQQAVPVGGVAESAQRHGKAALGLGVAPGVGSGNRGGHLLGRDVAVPADPHGEAGAARPGDGLAHAAHVRPGQFEIGGPQDRLVTQFQGVEPGFAIRLRSLRTGTHDAGRPAVRLGQRQPRVDGLRPCPRVAHRVAAGQADAYLDAVGDGGAAALRKHHRLVAAGREIAQGVVLAEQLEQPADRGLVLTREGVVGALRLEQHNRRRDECERAEQPKDRVEKDVRPAGELVGVDDGEADHPVDHVQEAGVRGQRAREHLDQAPRCQDPDDVPDNQHRCRFEQRRLADLGPELPISQEEKNDGDDVHREPEVLPERFRGGVVARGNLRGIQHGGEDHVAQQHHPGNALAGRQRRGQQCEHERPGDAGVRKVEEVVVDELPRDLDQPPDQR